MNLKDELKRHWLSTLIFIVGMIIWSLSFKYFLEWGDNSILGDFLLGSLPVFATLGLLLLIVYIVVKWEEKK